MSSPREIKIFTLIPCPHCNKDIFVVGRMEPMELIGSFTPAQVQAAKDAVKKAVEEDKEMDEITCHAALEWLKEEDTIFGPDDVKDIIDNFNKKTPNVTP
jgi:DNA-directed RNA polymerase subunit RPC12/RpoP